MAAAGGHWLKMAQGDIGKLVFVPKGQTAGQVITGRKPAGGGFPAALSETQTVKGLGGSTGATLVQDGSGNLYVRKSGDSAGHLLDESAADTAYQALGVDVAPHKVYQTPGGPVKLSKFVEGQTLNTVENNNPAAYAKAVKTLQKDFVSDAWLDNWDVIGLGKDNVLIGTNGKVYRIDNGGSLRYRAMGKLKGTGDTPPFTEFPNAIFSMRTMGQAGSVFGSLSAKDIAGQIGSVIAKSKGVLNAMPGPVKATMTKRLARLSQYRSIYKALSLKGYSDKSIDGFVKKLWSGLSAGTVKKDPKTPADVLKAFELLGG